MQTPKPYKEQRPWGEFVEFSRNTPTTVKILKVKPGESLSLQSHHGRDEFWHILSGNGVITKGNQDFEAYVGDEYFIPRETNHRIQAGTETLAVLEISYGTFQDEDIVRLEDRYGRESNPDNP